LTYFTCFSRRWLSITRSHNPDLVNLLAFIQQALNKDFGKSDGRPQSFATPVANVMSMGERISAVSKIL
jgi:hypothetical protein